MINPSSQDTTDTIAKADEGQIRSALMRLSNIIDSRDNEFQGSALSSAISAVRRIVTSRTDDNAVLGMIPAIIDMIRDERFSGFVLIEEIAAANPHKAEVFAALPALIEKLGDRYAGKVSMAAEIIYKIACVNHGEEVLGSATRGLVAVVERYAYGQNKEIEEMAAIQSIRALGEIGGDDARNSIQKALNSKSLNITFEVLKAMEKIEPDYFANSQTTTILRLDKWLVLVLNKRWELESYRLSIPKDFGVYVTGREVYAKISKINKMLDEAQGKKITVALVEELRELITHVRTVYWMNDTIQSSFSKPPKRPEPPAPLAFRRRINQ